MGERRLLLCLIFCSHVLRSVFPMATWSYHLLQQQPLELHCMESVLSYLSNQHHWNIFTFCVIFT